MVRWSYLVLGLTDNVFTGLGDVVIVIDLLYGISSSLRLRLATLPVFTASTNILFATLVKIRQYSTLLWFIKWRYMTTLMHSTCLDWMMAGADFSNFNGSPCNATYTIFIWLYFDTTFVSLLVWENVVKNSRQQNTPNPYLAVHVLAAEYIYFSFSLSEQELQVAHSQSCL